MVLSGHCILAGATFYKTNSKDLWISEPAISNNIEKLQVICYSDQTHYISFDITYSVISSVYSAITSPPHQCTEHFSVQCEQTHCIAQARSKAQIRTAGRQCRQSTAQCDITWNKEESHLEILEPIVEVVVVEVPVAEHGALEPSGDAALAHPAARSQIARGDSTRGLPPLTSIRKTDPRHLCLLLCAHKIRTRLLTGNGRN